MRIQHLASVKDALFSSIKLLIRKNSFNESSFYLYCILFINPAST